MSRVNGFFIVTLGLSIIATMRAGSFKFDEQTLTVPDGFEVVLAAGTNLVQRPVSASFDEQGRLYVTDSSGSNEPPARQLKNPTHRVLRLEDTDGDGVFDKSVVFADKVMFPQGCLWHDGWVYVAGPPSIWRFRDADGDGVAELREEWFKGGTLTGCANDIHGPYLGPDGYIYWTKGAFAEQTHALGNGRVLKDKAAHIYRARPDGSDLDVVMSGGMDNPVEVAFTPEGETIFTSTFIDFSQPGFRDGIGHAVYGGVFGKKNAVLEDGRVIRTSPDLLQPFVQFGPGAPSGLCRYESAVFGPEYQDNLFATLFNLHKITRHAPRPDGATYASSDSDFLVSDSLDFHPTDVLEDADGSLVILDTGGWYKLCCPTSQLSKPDVLGAIYRVRKINSPRIDDPHGSKSTWERMNPRELVKLLDDERPAVRARAMAALAALGNKAVKPLMEPMASRLSVRARQNAVWALARIPGDAARAAVRQYLYDDTEPRVQQVAVKVAGLWRDQRDLNQLGRLLSSDDLQLARAAAEALGRTGAAETRAMILREAARPGRTDDRFLSHSLIYALIETGAGGFAIPEESPSARRAALIALDQSGGNLKPADVMAGLAADDSALRDAAVWIVGRHPEWGDAVADYYRDRLADPDWSEAEGQALHAQLVKLAPHPSVQEVIAAALGHSETATARRDWLLRLLADANLQQVSPGLANAVRSSLPASDTETIQSAVAAARTFAQIKTNAPDFSPELLRVGADARLAPELRLEALAALSRGMKSVDAAQFNFLLANIDAARPVSIRSAAGKVLASAKLSRDQLLALAGALANVSPLEITKLLGAFEKSSDEAVGLKLVASLNDSAAASGLQTDVLKALLAKYPESVRQKGSELLASLDVDVAAQKARLDELMGALPDGDIRRGQVVFNGARAACASCHEIGYLGGSVGPDLTTIGTVRTERDLLEAIVFPSASFVRSYEPVIIITKDDELYSGVLRKDGDDEVVLATGPGVEVRIARADITEMRPGQVSVMPAGLDEQLTKQELADLLAFLKGTKWGPNR